VKTINRLFDKLLCGLGVHEWDYQGGHCRACDKCDEFYDEHWHCRQRGKPV
jgi:hypothetical protein